MELFDQFGDAQWENVSGDVTALSDEIDCHSIKTDMWRKKGWSYTQLYIYLGESKIYLDGKWRTYYEQVSM